MDKVKNRKLLTAVCILSLLILSACGQALPAMPTPTLTIVPTESPTNTVTPLPTNTSTPSPTPTEKIKQFNQCDADHWKDCYIPSKDLISGAYLNWVNVNWNPNLPLPDPSKVVLHPMGGKGHLFYTGTDGKAIPIEDKPYAVGFTYGWTKCKAELAKGIAEMICAVAPMAVAVPGKLGETRIIIGVQLQSWDETDADMAGFLRALETNGNVMIAGFYRDRETGKTSLDNSASPILDLVKGTLTRYPDVYERIEKYKETYDPSTLSQPGIIFMIFPTG